MWSPVVRDAGRQIAEALEDGGGRALVIVFGPGGDTLERVIAAAWSQLDAGVRLRAHHLGVDGLDPTVSYGDGWITVVLGFDEIEPSDRREALLALNRGRDLIRETGTRLVLLLPDALRELLYEHASDLLSWRDLLVRVGDGPEGVPLGPPPSWLRIDLIAERAVALVGPWLSGEDAAELRALALRLPWAGLVATTGERGVVDAIPGVWTSRERFAGPAPEEGALPFRWALPEDAAWDGEALVTEQILQLVPLWIGEEGWLQRWDSEALARARFQSQGQRSSAEQQEALDRMARALVWMEMGRWEGRKPWEREPFPAQSRRIPALVTVVIGERQITWHHFHDERFGQNVQAHRTKPWPVQLAALAELGAAPFARRRLLVAFGLETSYAHWPLLPVLRGVTGPVVVEGYDRTVEGGLTALGRPFRVVAGDEDLASDGVTHETLVLRPWGDPVRPDTLFLSEEDFWRHLDRNPRFEALLVGALQQPVLWMDDVEPSLRTGSLARLARPRTRAGVHWVLPVWSDLSPLQRMRLSLEGLTPVGAPRGTGWAALADWIAGVEMPVVVEGVEPPLDLPAEGEELRRELLDEREVQALGGGPSEALLPTLDQRPRLRVVGVSPEERKIFAQVLCWAVRARQAGDPLWSAWWPVGLEGVHDAAVVPLVDLATMKVPLTRWCTERFGVAAGLVVLVAERRGQPGDEQDLETAASSLLGVGPELRVLVLDEGQSFWALDEDIPTFRVLPRSGMPRRWAAWLLRQHRPSLAALPALLRLAEGDSPDSSRLRTLDGILDLRTMQDPIDVYGSRLRCGLAESQLRLEGAWVPGIHLHQWGHLPWLWVYLALPLGERLHAFLARFPLNATRAPEELARLCALLRLGALTTPWELQHLPTILPFARRTPADEDPRAWLDARVPVPAGEHALGSSAYQDTPPRSVRLSAYDMDALPVTWARYQIFVTAGGYTREDLWSPEGWRWRVRERIVGPLIDPALLEERGPPPVLPVTGVSWFEADAFARWQGRVLPSEARWETAARLGSGAKPGDRVVPVGQEPRPRGELPIFDLGGNILEWCADWYSARYPLEGSRYNPRGPADGVERSVRGPPHWVQGEDGVLLCRRWHFPPETRRADLGFRTVSR